MIKELKEFLKAIKYIWNVAYELNDYFVMGFLAFVGLEVLACIVLIFMRLILSQ